MAGTGAKKRPLVDLERGDLAPKRLRKLLKASTHPVLEVSGGTVELQAGKKLIRVPERLAARCKVLRVDGSYSTLAREFASWLQAEWAREQAQAHRSHVSPVVPMPARTLLQMVKTCDVLQDDSGLQIYVRELRCRMIALPIAYALPAPARKHYTDTSCSLPLQEIEQLPTEVLRAVFTSPLEILDRLPQGSCLAPLVCEVYNSWFQQRTDAFEAAPSWTASERWAWRSALAAAAGTQIYVQATEAMQRTRIEDDFPGLQVRVLLSAAHETRVLDLTRRIRHNEMSPDRSRLVSKVDQCYRDAAGDFAGIPGGVEHAALEVPQWITTWTGIKLPPSVKSLALRQYRQWYSFRLSGTAAPRLSVSRVACTPQLRRLEIDASKFALKGVRLPEGLTFLAISAPAGFSEKLANFRLPASLRVLRLSGRGMQVNARTAAAMPSELQCLCMSEVVMYIRNNSPVALPPGLSMLQLSSDYYDNRSLRHVRPADSLSVLCVDGSGDPGGMRLPAGLTRLTLSRRLVDTQRGYSIAQMRWGKRNGNDVARLDLPEGLKELNLSRLPRGWHRVVSSQALPSSVTRLALLDVQAKKWLEAVLWPDCLRALELHRTSAPGTAMEPTVRLRILPAALLSLSVCGCDLELGRGAALPSTLTSLAVAFAASMASASVIDAFAPARNLKSVSADALSVRKLCAPPHAGLPDTVTRLVMHDARLPHMATDVVRLPCSLRVLQLENVTCGAGGLQCLKLPAGLTMLCMGSRVTLGRRRFEGVQLPDALEALDIAGIECAAERAAAWPPFPAALRFLRLSAPDSHALHDACKALPRALERLAVIGSDARIEEVRGWIGEDCRVQLSLHDGPKWREAEVYGVDTAGRWDCDAEEPLRLNGAYDLDCRHGHGRAPESSQYAPDQVTCSFADFPSHCGSFDASAGLQTWYHPS